MEQARRVPQTVQRRLYAVGAVGQMLTVEKGQVGERAQWTHAGNLGRQQLWTLATKGDLDSANLEHTDSF